MSYLLPRGRISRARFWLASILLILAFAILFAGIEALIGRAATWILYPPFLWLAFVIASKRYHDFDRSPYRLLLLVIPIVGPIVVAFDLAFRKGSEGSNRYGADPLTEGIDYQSVKLPLLDGDGRAIVNDVTALNPVRVAAIVVPESVDAVREAIRRSSGPISVGGGHFSMGGQTASEGSLHLDMRRLNQMLEVGPTEKTVRVQSGVRGCDLQKFLDPHGLAVKIMQTYANFTVGGALSVNCHGRYVGLGPLILSVRSITLVLADGTLVTASPSENSDLFYASIGGYNALGVIVEAELDLADNTRVDRILYLRRPVHWRNYEAGYDVAELEPFSRKATTYVLQEYFVPVDRFDEFVPKMAEILQRHRVNMINISVRHALADPGSLLAWARDEVFAFVLYYKQRIRENAKTRVGVWTRELIDAALSCGGTYYLPYQPHATEEQFHKAYPRAKELFALKRKYDPQFRFRNVLWDKYYAWKTDNLVGPEEPGQAGLPLLHSDFQSVFGSVASFDAFYLFLQNVYHIYPEDRFQALIQEACVHSKSDEEIYRYIQQRLPDIKPALADVSYALPALKKQKEEMARQTLEILGDRKKISGYVEIGSTGRYVSELQDHIGIEEPIYVIHDAAPTNSPVDIAERGGLAKIGTFLPLDDYAPLSAEIPDHGIDVVTCFIGLHPP